jgi:hypothetical protein
MHRIPRGLLAVLICALGMLGLPAAAGAAEDARAQFAAGVAAAAEGDHAAALAAFLAARDAGLQGPAVHYNIGVSAWAVGDLDRAESAFRETARHAAMAPLAHYNLGLVSRRRGDLGAARHWFTLALQEAGDDPALRQLAADALAALPVPAPAPDWTAARAAAFFLSIGAGHDDNVALLADGDLLGVSELASPYAELQAAVAAPLPAQLSLQAGVFLVDYTDLSELSQRGAQVELLYGPRIGPWRIELGGGYSLNQIDGERFEDQRSLLAGATRSLGADWQLRLRLRYADIDGREPYAGLTGDRVDAAMRLRRNLGPHRLQAEYRFETNDRASDELSPDRHRIDLEWRQDLARQLRATLALGWRHSRYRTAGFSWTERRTIVGAGLGGPIHGPWEWALRYDWTDNSASLAEFEYDRNRFFVGAQASF